MSFQYASAALKLLKSSSRFDYFIYREYYMSIKRAVDTQIFILHGEVSIGIV
jgi:hypothetical protein